MIGVDDKGTPLGLENDRFLNEDEMDQHLANLIRDRLGADHTFCLHQRFMDRGGKRVLVVRCDHAKSPEDVPRGGERQGIERRENRADPRRAEANRDAGEREALKSPARFGCPA